MVYFGNVFDSNYASCRRLRAVRISIEQVEPEASQPDTPPINWEDIKYYLVLSNLSNLSNLWTLSS